MIYTAETKKVKKRFLLLSLGVVVLAALREIAIVYAILELMGQHTKLFL
jgi:hypothetical protein